MTPTPLLIALAILLPILAVSTKRYLQNPDKRRKITKKNILIVITLICLVVLSYDVVIGGNIKFYNKWRECSSRPYVINPTWRMKGQPDYYAEAKSFQIEPRIPSTYFCTALEAEQAGYSANPGYYDFPNLKKENNQKKADDQE